MKSEFSFINKEKKMLFAISDMNSEFMNKKGSQTDNPDLSGLDDMHKQFVDKTQVYECFKTNVVD